MRHSGYFYKNQLLINIGLHKMAITFLHNEDFNNLKDIIYFRSNVPHLYSGTGLGPYSCAILITNEGISGTLWYGSQIYGKKTIL